MRLAFALVPLQPVLVALLLAWPPPLEGAPVFVAAIEAEPEAPVGPARVLRKWGELLDRHAGAAEACVRQAICLDDGLAPLAGRLAGRPLATQLAAVNAFVNAARYVSDRENWGASDHWALPSELFARGGDCEDFAIAKYFALRALGLPPGALRLMVLNDRGRGEAHAVLLVADGTQTLVLDNLSPEIRPWREVSPRYLSLYSVNEERAWVHALPPAALPGRGR